MASISELHAATLSTDVEIDPLPVSRSFLSRVMARFRIWRPHFKRNDRQQVTHPETTESRVSDTIEATQIELDEYLATPTALTTPTFSVGSSICSGVVDMDWAYDLGGGSRRVTNAQISGLGFSTSRGALELEGLPRLRMVDADGVLPTTDFCAPLTQLEVCSLRFWTSVTYPFGLGYTFDQRSFDSISWPHSSHSTGSRSVFEISASGN